MRARAWSASLTEPSTWDIDVTDDGVTAAGDLRISYHKISSARGARVDDVHLQGW
jgi:hypothetical protein